MLDPLRSLAELVRTLTRSRAEGRTQTSEASRQLGVSTGGKPPVTGLQGAEDLRERLRQRLRLIGKNDRRRAREVFVETVLASELGESMTLDPLLADVVSKVAQQLGNDDATDRDLTLLIDELAG